MARPGGRRQGRLRISRERFCRWPGRQAGRIELSHARGSRVNQRVFRMAELPSIDALKDKCVHQFLRHLASERGASVYTERNYRQALTEYYGWHRQERQQPPVWARLQRDDFRAYLRFLGRGKLSRAAIQ